MPRPRPQPRPLSRWLAAARTPASPTPSTTAGTRCPRCSSRPWSSTRRTSPGSLMTGLSPKLRSAQATWQRTVTSENEARSGSAPRLQMQGIRKSFGSVDALRGVDLEVAPGQIMALVGDNGAGKSTLVKALSGVGIADAGTIRVDGQEVRINGPQDAVNAGIETVYQDLALCDNLDVVANLYLGRELRAPERGPAAR